MSSSSEIQESIDLSNDDFETKQEILPSKPIHNDMDHSNIKNDHNHKAFLNKQQIRNKGKKNDSQSYGTNQRKHSYSSNVSATSGSSKKAGNDILAEELSIFNQSGNKVHGKKKTQISISHLLNFQLPPRQSDHYTYHGSKNKSKSYGPTFNKERFVNANYKFIMRHDEKYSVNIFDPDLFVDWNHIIQAIVPASNIPTCPICLSTPVVPQVAKCGHIFCWPCILHYISVGEDKKRWRKCPICFETIHQNDIKPVKFNIIDNLSDITPKNTRKLKLVLMKRRLTSAIALPKNMYGKWQSSSGNNLESPQPPSVRSIEAAPYSKLMLSTPEYIKNEILIKEKRSLDDMIQQISSEQMLINLGEKNVEDSSSELPFIEMALNSINEQIIKLNENVNNILSSDQNVFNEVDKIKDTQTEIKEQNLKENMSKSPVNNDNKIEKNIKSYSKINKSNKSDLEYCYFYQAINGQNVFLHPLDIKILKHEYNDYNEFPETINATVVFIQETTVTEDLRKRCKSLSHLPLSCDVTLIQIDLDRHVSENTLNIFANELGIRARKQHDLERKADIEAKISEEKRSKQLKEELENGNDIYNRNNNYYIQDTQFPIEFSDNESKYTEIDDFGKGLTLSEFLKSDAVKNSTKKKKKKKPKSNDINLIDPNYKNIDTSTDNIYDIPHIEHGIQVGRRRMNKKMFKTGNTLFDKNLIEATLAGNLNSVENDTFSTSHIEPNGYYYDIPSFDVVDASSNASGSTNSVPINKRYISPQSSLNTKNDEPIISSSFDSSIEVTSSFSEITNSSTCITSIGNIDTKSGNKSGNSSLATSPQTVPTFSFANVAKGVQKPSNNCSSIGHGPEGMWPSLGDSVFASHKTEPRNKWIRSNNNNNNNNNNNPLAATTSSASLKPFDPFSTSYAVLAEEALPANGIANPLVASATAGETSMMLLNSAKRKQSAKQRKKEQRDRLFGDRISQKDNQLE